MKNEIAILHYSYPPVIGGVEFIMEGHARVLARNGYSVQIISGAGASKVNNVDVRIIENFSADSPITKTVQKELLAGEVTDNFKTLKTQLKTDIIKALEDIEVCFIHNVLTMHFNMALTAALHEVIDEFHSSKKFYAWCHDASLNQQHYSLPQANTYPWNLLGTFNKNSEYIAISGLRQTELSKLFKVEPGDISVVPDGIDVQSFLGIKDIVWDIAAELDLFNQELVMFFPSRILRRKNYELAIKITAGIKKIMPKCKLLFTGPPDPHNPAAAQYLKELRLLIKELDLEQEAVFIHDLKEKYQEKFKIGYIELQNLYSLSDILLLTSSQEGFGLPMLEAAAKRLPIACSDIPPCLEVTDKNALIFGLEDDPEEIAERIIEFLRKQPTYKMFRRLMSDYSWEAIYSKYLTNLIK